MCAASLPGISHLLVAMDQIAIEGQHRAGVGTSSFGITAVIAADAGGQIARRQCLLQDGCADLEIGGGVEQRFRIVDPMAVPANVDLQQADIDRTIPMGGKERNGLIPARREERLAFNVQRPGPGFDQPMVISPAALGESDRLKNSRIVEAGLARNLVPSSAMRFKCDGGT